MSSIQEQASQNSVPSQKPVSIPPMSTQQEGKSVHSPTCCSWLNSLLELLADAIIHTRITNDEKALRKVTKKFYNYTTVAYNTLVPPPPGSGISVDDARDAFFVELASFHLSLKKSFMVCEAEARQVEEYQRERERIGEYQCPPIIKQVLTQQHRN